MNQISTSQINLLAVGVENYQYMRRLHGPKKDVERFTDLFAQSPATGLFSGSQIKTLLDPDLNTLHTVINDFVISRSVEGDILIFYFSGHGTPIGPSDFGFCTKDARIHNATGSILPLTVLKLKDLTETLRVMNIIPVLIIDACYSGIAGNALEIPPNDMMNIIHSTIARQNATNYAVFSACTDREYAIGNANGGLFSQLIFDVMSEGINNKKNKRKPNLSLQDIFDQMRTRVVSSSLSSTPQLFIGNTLPEFPIIKNAKYTPLEYQFTPYLKEILLVLWNEGQEQELKIGEILQLVGRGAYGNHRKLSLDAWGLVEDNLTTKKRRLTERGRQFIQGRITIPDAIVYDHSSNIFISSPQATQITISMV